MVAATPTTDISGTTINKTVKLRSQLPFAIIHRQDFLTFSLTQSLNRFQKHFLCDNRQWNSSFVLKRRRPTSDANPFNGLGALASGWR